MCVENVMDDNGMWYIWKHKNEIIFKNRKCDVIEVLTLIQSKIWAILREKYKDTLFFIFWLVFRTIDMHENDILICGEYFL